MNGEHQWHVKREGLSSVHVCSDDDEAQEGQEQSAESAQQRTSFCFQEQPQALEVEPENTGHAVNSRGCQARARHVTAAFT